MRSHCYNESLLAKSKEMVVSKGNVVANVAAIEVLRRGDSFKGKLALIEEQDEGRNG